MIEQHERFYKFTRGVAKTLHAIGLPLKDESGNTLGYLLEVEPLTVEG